MLPKKMMNPMNSNDNDLQTVIGGNVPEHFRSPI